MKNRNSRIELLKILAIFLITLSHCVQSSQFNIGVSSSDYNLLIINIIRTFGSVGNIIFIICSSYFLLKSEKTKFNKIVHLVADVLIISIIWLLLFLLSGHELGFKDIIKSFLPLTFNNNWFISCYIIFYIIHPYLNIIIKNVNNKQLLRICIFFFILYCCLQVIFTNKYFFNELFGFIIIYFFVAFYNYYINFERKTDLIIAILSVFVYLVYMVSINYIGLHYSIFSDKILRLNNMMNPLFIIFSIAIFDLANKKYISLKMVDFLSSLSLIYYLIHENILFRNYLRPNIFLWFKKNIIIDNKIAVLMIFSFIIFVLCYTVSIIYKFVLYPFFHRIVERVYYIFKEVYLYFENKIFTICCKYNKK